MYQVYGHPASRTVRVLWALEEMGLPYTLHPVRPRSEGILAINPTGKIPALVTGDGAVLTDSVAILTFLADRHGQLTYPAGTLERAAQDAALHYVLAEVDAALWLNGKHAFVLPPERRVKAVRETAAWEYARAMDHLAEMKGDRPYLAGDRFTIADIVLSHCAGWGLRSRFPMPGGSFGDYLKSLRKREAMQRVMQLVLEHETQT